MLELCLTVGIEDGLNHFVRAVTRGNKVTANKMAKQVQQVTTKDPKKVEQGKGLAEHNRMKREELTQMKAQKSES